MSQKLRIMNLNMISVGLLLLILFITTGAIIGLSLETENAIFSGVQDKLISIANSTSVQIDGDSLAILKSGDEKTSEFLLIRDQLRRIKNSNSDVNYIYTMRKSGDSVEFVVDGDYGFTTDAAFIGQIYSGAPSDLLAGFNFPTTDKKFTTDQWGTVLSGYSPVRDKSGAVVGIVGVDINSTSIQEKLNYLNRVYYFLGFFILILSVFGIIINERRRIAADLQVRESEEKYRFLFEEAADAIFLIDADEDNIGTIVEVNRAAAKMHGYSVEELKGMNITELDTPEAKNLSIQAFNRMLTGELLMGELSLIKKDGTIFPVEVSAGLVDLGTKRYIISVDRDISEKKLASDAIKRANNKLSVLTLQCQV